MLNVGTSLRIGSIHQFRLQCIKDVPLTISRIEPTAGDQPFAPITSLSFSRIITNSRHFASSAA